MMTMTACQHKPTDNPYSDGHITAVISDGISMRLPCQRHISLSRHRRM